MAVRIFGAPEAADFGLGLGRTLQLVNILRDLDEDALRAFISELNEDEQASLIALAWIGRGDYGADDWEEARNLARERNIRDPATYLLGIEMLGDMLEEGLEALGLSLDDLEG
jgi:hypothetical protein